MSNNLKLIIFVIILGSVTSLFLLGMDALTSDRIEANREAEFKSVILNAYNVSFNFGNIHDVFDEKVNRIEKSVTVGENVEIYVFYQDLVTNAISFEFSGDGVWGEISGVITLDSTFTTILNITVLQQVETPGLGGIIATRKYLDTFNGITFIDDEIQVIRKDNIPNAENEVDAIAGATRTSNAFETIINQTYALYKNAWFNGVEVES